MHTTEEIDSHAHELYELSEEIGAEMAQARRASGLSPVEFAHRLGVPVSFAEILENGILVADDKNHYQRWKGCPFTKGELMRISGRFAKEAAARRADTRPDSERVFFYPVTISSDSVMDEIRMIAECEDPASCMAQDTAARLGMKHRIAYEHTRLERGKKAAESVKQRVLAALAAHEKRL